MALAVEDILNQALRRISYSVPIGSIYEGSRASRAAVEFYGQTRDDLLQSRDWMFARQEAALVLLKTAPVGGYGGTVWTAAYPLLPWIYEYAYPSNCLEVRSVRPTPILMPEYDPQPHIFTVANDPTVPASSKVVLTNLPAAIATYTARITNPADWSPEPMFIESLIAALGLRFQEALNPQQDAVKDRASEEQASAAMADEHRG